MIYGLKHLTPTYIFEKKKNLPKSSYYDNDVYELNRKLHIVCLKKKSQFSENIPKLWLLKIINMYGMLQIYYYLD